MKKMAESQPELSSTIAKHYNELQESGLQQRTKSRIFYMRNFNNWIKSMLIADTLQRIRKEAKSDQSITVLDLCAGKGGDLLKWKKGRIDRLVCADIAGTSLEQAESRHKEMLDREKTMRYPHKSYTAEFITADCSKERLKEKYAEQDMQFDLCSCQFSYHYSFESYEQADMMLRNACECLRPGGYYIGTTLNSNEILKRLRASDQMSFGNEVFNISFASEDKHKIPLFGAQYFFQLEGVVDCPEFLVHFPLLEKMAEKYNMKLVYKKSFADYFSEQVELNDGRGLIGRMQALEPYPADDVADLSSSDKASYEYVEQRIQELKTQNSNPSGEQGRRNTKKVGTLSKPEWEAVTLYLVFAFQKIDDGATVAEDASADASNPASTDLTPDGTTNREADTAGENAGSPESPAKRTKLE